MASCLLHLAKSCARQESLVDIAAEVCEIIYRIYPYEGDSTPGIHDDFNQWIRLIIDLYQNKDCKFFLDKDKTIVAPSKEKIINIWKHSSLLDIKQLKETINLLMQKLNPNFVEK